MLLWWWHVCRIRRYLSFISRFIFSYLLLTLAFPFPVLRYAKPMWPSYMGNHREFVGQLINWIPLLCTQSDSSWHVTILSMWLSRVVTATNSTSRLSLEHHFVFMSSYCWSYHTFLITHIIKNLYRYNLYMYVFIYRLLEIYIYFFQVVFK